MDFRKTLDQVRNDEISGMDVFNEILDKTRENPDRIKLYIEHIENYLLIKETGNGLPIMHFLREISTKNLTVENTNDIEYHEWQRECIEMFQDSGWESVEDMMQETKKADSLPLGFNLIYVKLIEHYKENNSSDGYVNPSIKNLVVLRKVYILRNDLIKYIEPKTETPPTLSKTPFKDDKTKGLFEYIVEHWDNDKATKWGYIWEYLFTKENGRLTNKTDYEAYLRVNYNFTKGKPNYESCNSENRYSQLEELKKRFSVNLDLN